MQKYVFVKLLEQPPDNGVFHMKDWPLHVTVVPLFAIDKTEDELLKLVRKITKNTPPPSATADKDELFGVNHDLRVTILDMSQELKHMHKHIYSQLISRGAVFDQPQYCGENYRAHTTVQKSGRLQRGDKVVIDELALVDMFHNGDIRQRRIIDSIRLKS